MSFGMGDFMRDIYRPTSIGEYFGIADPLGDMLEGPDSLGDPAKAPDPNAVAEQEAEDMAVRADIIRRNQLKNSSTAGTGADFIKKMNQNPARPLNKKNKSYNAQNTNPNFSLPTSGTGALGMTNQW